MTERMRLAHVVTYISSDGAFGGPVAVAVAQCTALAEAGHQVDLYAGWDGVAEVVCPGVTLHLFPVRRRRRLTLMVAPRMALALLRARRRFDAIHLHLGRDLISVGAWSAVRSRRDRVVVQPHGMLPPGSGLALAVLDAVSTRAALRGARAVLALTPQEELDLAAVARGPIPVSRIRNGIGVLADVPLGRQVPPVVLFLARLHPRKNVMVFAEAARQLVASGSPAIFKVVGPDEGDLGRLRAFAVEHALEERLVYAGSVGPGDGPRELADASVYVLPSIGEVYPMAVLEALAVGTPVVLSEDCGLSPSLAESGAAIVTVPRPAKVAAAVAGVISDEASRLDQAGRGHAYARSHLAVDAVVQRLMTVYRAAS